MTQSLPFFTMIALRLIVLLGNNNPCKNASLLSRFQGYYHKTYCRFFVLEEEIKNGHKIYSVFEKNVVKLVTLLHEGVSRQLTGKRIKDI